MKHRELSMDELTLVHGGDGNNGTTEVGSLLSILAGAITDGYPGAFIGAAENPASAGDFPADTQGYVDANGVPIGNGGVCVDPGDVTGGQIGGIDVSGIDVGDISVDVGGDVGGIDIGGF